MAADMSSLSADLSAVISEVENGTRRDHAAQPLTGGMQPTAREAAMFPAPVPLMDGPPPAAGQPAAGGTSRPQHYRLSSQEPRGYAPYPRERAQPQVYPFHQTAPPPVASDGAMTQMRTQLRERATRADG
eukprot:7524959-Pyramimonas_sp.AAC.1